MKRLAWLVLLLGTYWLTLARADEIDDNVKALRDPDAAIRKNAAAALAQSGKDALPKLVEVLKKEKNGTNKELQLALLGALATIGPDPADKDLRLTLLQMLKTKPELRLDATRVLGRLGAPGAEALRNVLKSDKDVEIRRHALLGLGYAGEDAKEHVKEISRNLSFKQDAKIRTAAAEALGRIGTHAEAATSDLAKAAKDKDVPVRWHAAVALAHVAPEDKKALDVAVALINDDAAWKACAGPIAQSGAYGLGFLVVAMRAKDENVRFKALQSMAAVPPDQLGEAAATAVGPSLKDDSLGIRRAAVGVLAKMGGASLGKAVPLVAEALKDKDPGIRGQALQIITKMGADANNASPRLAELLKEKDPELRKQVVGVLEKQAEKAAPAALALIVVTAENKELLPDTLKLLEKFGPKALPLYMEGLKHENAMVRQMSAEQIGKLGPAGREAAAILGQTLRDMDKGVRGASADALEKVGKGVIPGLREQLKDKTPAMRAQAAETLGELGPKAKIAVPEIRLALADKEGVVRFQAALALKKIGDAKEVASDLIKLLDDPQASIRKLAASALEEVGADAKDAVPGLTRMLRSRDRAARQQAVNTLKAIGLPARAAVPELTNLVMDSDPDVRNGAIQALGKIGPDARDAVPALVLLFKDKEENIRSLASTAVGDIGQPAIPVLREALTYDDKDVRQYAAISFVNMGPKAKDAVKDLAAGLKDKEPEVRKAIILSLKEIGPDTKPIIPQLVEALQDTEPDVRTGAIMTLSTMGLTEKAALTALGLALKDKEDIVRAVAIEAIAKLGPAGVPALIDALKDKDKNGRIAAAIVLERLGPVGRAAVPALNEAAKDPNDDVRIAVNKALEKIGK
jgi:HEAT repeat protein